MPSQIENIIEDIGDLSIFIIFPTIIGGIIACIVGITVWLYYGTTSLVFYGIIAGIIASIICFPIMKWAIETDEERDIKNKSYPSISASIVSIAIFVGIFLVFTVISFILPRIISWLLEGSEGNLFWYYLVGIIASIILGSIIGVLIGGGVFLLTWIIAIVYSLRK